MQKVAGSGQGPGSPPGLVSWMVARAEGDQSLQQIVVGDQGLVPNMCGFRQNMRGSGQDGDQFVVKARLVEMVGQVPPDVGGRVAQSGH